MMGRTNKTLASPDSNTLVFSLSAGSRNTLLLYLYATLAKHDAALLPSKPGHNCCTDVHHYHR